MQSNDLETMHLGRGRVETGQGSLEAPNCHFTNACLGGMQSQVRQERAPAAVTAWEQSPGPEGLPRAHCSLVQGCHRPRRQTRSHGLPAVTGGRRRDPGRENGAGRGFLQTREATTQLTATGPAGVGADLTLRPPRSTSLA